MGRTPEQWRILSSKPRFSLFLGTLVVMAIIQGAVVLNYHQYWISYPHGDNILHIGWGLVMFLGLISILEISVLDAIMLCLVWQFFWEAGETLMNPVPGYYQDHFFFDGMKDTMNNGLGALLGMSMLYGMRDGTAGLRKSSLRSLLYFFLGSMIPMLLFGAYWMLQYNQTLDALMMWWVYGWGLVTVAVMLWEWRFPASTAARHTTPRQPITVQNGRK